MKLNEVRSIDSLGIFQNLPAPPDRISMPVKFVFKCSQELQRPPVNSPQAFCTASVRRYNYQSILKFVVIMVLWLVPQGQPTIKHPSPSPHCNATAFLIKTTFLENIFEFTKLFQNFSFEVCQYTVNETWIGVCLLTCLWCTTMSMERSW